MKVFAIFVFVLMVVGCQKSSQVPDDDSESASDGDSGLSTATETATGSDSGDTTTETATGSDTADTATDTVPDSDSVDSDSNGQPPIQFVIRNATSGPRYLSLNFGRYSVLSCETSQGEPCYLFNSLCASSCVSVTPADDCMILCEWYPEVQLLNPGETVALGWNGTMTEIVENYCADNGRCTVEAPAPLDTYTVSVKSYSDIVCAFVDDCDRTPDENGIIGEVNAEGEMTEITADFELPRQTDVELIISQ